MEKNKKARDVPRTSQQKINIKVKIDKKNIKIKDVAIYANGRQVLTANERRASSIKGGIKKISVSLSAHQKSIVKVEVTNIKKARAWVVTEISPRKPQQKIVPPGDLILLAVGVNTLDHIKGNSLDFPSSDAMEVIKIIKKTEGNLFNNVQTFLFNDTSDPPALSGKIKDTLNALRKAKSEDTVMIFLVGHGVTTEKNEFLFLTKDAKKNEEGDYDMNSVLSWETLKAALNKVDARKILFLDTGYSGEADMTDIVKKGSDHNITVFASSSGSRIIRGSQKGKGYFTTAILKGLSKGLPADTSGNGQVEIRELAGYVKKEVKKLSGTQTPVLALPTGLEDFSFFVP